MLSKTDVTTELRYNEIITFIGEIFGSLDHDNVCKVVSCHASWPALIKGMYQDLKGY